MKKTKFMAAIAAATMAIASVSTLPFSASATTRVPYMLGDIDNDFVIELDDAFEVMRQLNLHGFEQGMKVRTSYVQAHLSDWFPNAVCAAAADADKDGYISHDDYDLIMWHYSNSAAGNTDNKTDIGKLFLYITD